MNKSTGILLLLIGIAIPLVIAGVSQPGAVGGSQTPMTNNVSGDGYSLTDLDSVTATNFTVSSHSMLGFLGAHPTVATNTTAEYIINDSGTVKKYIVEFRSSAIPVTNFMRLGP